MIGRAYRDWRGNWGRWKGMRAELQGMPWEQRQSVLGRVDRGLVEWLGYKFMWIEEEDGDGGEC